MTANQLRQALRTYTTHGLLWLILSVWLGAHVPLLGWSSDGEELPIILCLTQMGNVGLGGVMGLMLKLQFSNSRARLLPGFRAVHLIVAGAIVVAFVAFEAVLILAMGGAGALLLLSSLSLFVIAATAWANYWMSPIGSIYFLLIMGLLFASVFAEEYVAGPLQALGDSPIACLAIACVGLAAMASLAARLWILSEEMSEYSRLVPVNWDFSSRAGSRGRRRLEAQAFARIGNRDVWRDAQLRFALRLNKPMGPLRRLLLRQLAGGIVGLPLMAIALVGTLSLLLFQSWLRKPIDASSVFLLSFFPQQIVLGMLGGVWLHRWPFLTLEYFRPLGRQGFVRDLARSIAYDIAGPAAVHCAMIVIWLELIRPHEAPAGLLLPWLALTAAQYLVAYSLTFWLVSLRRPLVHILGITVASMGSALLVMAALFFTAEGFWSPVNVAAVIVATALVVGLLYQLAFRRWCRLDLD